MATATAENQVSILKNQAAILANQKEILAGGRQGTPVETSDLIGTRDRN